ncbi:hypothetical protein DFJ74DRAFT_655219 [Hyaloraphidium curvatum]|nr:hypothetical protein DFJ74DRAFT_655219 [Hyaloraphidium curvatum]
MSTIQQSRSKGAFRTDSYASRRQSQRQRPKDDGQSKRGDVCASGTRRRWPARRLGRRAGRGPGRQFGDCGGRGGGLRHRRRPGAGNGGAVGSVGRTRGLDVHEARHGAHHAGVRVVLRAQRDGAAAAGVRRAQRQRALERRALARAARALAEARARGVAREDVAGRALHLAERPLEAGGGEGVAARRVVAQPAVVGECADRRGRARGIAAAARAGTEPGLRWAGSRQAERAGSKKASTRESVGPRAANHDGAPARGPRVPRARTPQGAAPGAHSAAASGEWE